MRSYSFGIILGLFLATASMYAQEAVSATGGEATGVGGSASYTVGQTVYTSVKGSTGSVSQGVQQAYTVVIESSIGDDASDILLECVAYPNPVTSILKLRVDETAGLSYLLVNETGQLLDKQVVSESITNISMEAYVANSYFLKVIKEGVDIKVFKIIKK